MSTGRMPLANPGAEPIRKPPILNPAQIKDVISYLTSLAPGGPPIPGVDVNAGDLSQGNQVFTLNCAACHAATGNGGAVGPEVAPGLHKATPVQIAEAIRAGPGTMPVFGPGVIDQQQLDSVVRYVLYLRAPEDRGGASLDHGGPIIEGFVALFVALLAVVLVTRFIGERSAG
jgi:ubiquinol-cytochrome c reductase cytochrome c subunit